MDFKHNVITENTERNREWFKFIGYKEVNVSETEDFLITLTCKRTKNRKTYIEHFYTSVSQKQLMKDLPKYKNHFIFLNQEENLRGVSAIRNDSDINQWFIADTDFNDELEWFFCDKENIKECETYTTFTKATVDDIIIYNRRSTKQI